MTGLRRLLRTEFRLIWRDRVLMVIAILLPVALLLIFGLIPSAREVSADFGGQRGIDTVLPSMVVTISVAVLAFFALPSYLATYREKGILRRLSTTPASPAALLLAQVAVNVVLALGSIALAIAVGVEFLDLHLPKHVPGFLAGFAFGTVALFALGLLIAALAPSARAAQGFAMVLFFPSMFFAGMYLPKELMPDSLARICDFTPMGALRQTVQDAWVGTAPDLWQLAFLGVLAIGLTTVSARLFRWE